MGERKMMMMRFFGGVCAVLYAYALMMRGWMDGRLGVSRLRSELEQTRFY